MGSTSSAQVVGRVGSKEKILSLMPRHCLGGGTDSPRKEECRDQGGSSRELCRSHPFGAPVWKWLESPKVGTLSGLGGKQRDSAQAQLGGAHLTLVSSPKLLLALQEVRTEHAHLHTDLYLSSCIAPKSGSPWSSSPCVPLARSMQ